MWQPPPGGPTSCYVDTGGDVEASQVGSQMALAVLVKAAVSFQVTNASKDKTMMDGYGMGYGMGYGWIWMILIVVLVGVAIAALLKYLRK